MKKKKALVYFLVFISMVIWGLSYVWTKQVYLFYTPITTVFLRILIATFFFLFLTFILKKFQVLRKKDIKIFLILGIFDPLGFFLFEGLGLKYSSPTIAAVIISTIPLFLPIVTYFTLNERLSKSNITGLLISFAGVLLVLIKEDFTLAISLFGIALLFLAVAFSISSNIILKKLSNHYNTYSLIAWLNIISTAYFIPIFLIFEYPDFIQVPLSSTALIPLFALAIFASGLAFLFYIKGLKEIGVAKTNIFVNIIPVFAAIFSFLFLDETLTIRVVLGIFVVISGLIISQWKSLLKFKNS